MKLVGPFLAAALFGGITAAYVSVMSPHIYAQEVTPSPAPSVSPSPLAHLTFRTCLIPNTERFRLFFRADYMPGEYRIVGQNTGITINMGYLEVGQTSGGFGADNTTYVIPEDTWLKQWYNGTRWQRSGGIPVTDVDQHLAEGAVCEEGEHSGYFPYASPTPTPSTLTTSETSPSPQILAQTTVTASPTPTPTPTSPPSPTPTPTPSDTAGVGGTSATPTPSPSPSVQQQKERAAQILGATTLAATGSRDIFFAWGRLGVGTLLTVGGLLRLRKKIE